MSRIILDTSIYIPFLRKGILPAEVHPSPETTVYLSSVVAQELLAGTGDDVTLQSFKRFCNVFKQNRRFITPSTEDWLICGGLLSKLGRKHGFEIIKRGRLVNDVLIALACKQVDATLITSNKKDFEMIRSFLEFEYSVP